MLGSVPHIGDPTFDIIPVTHVRDLMFDINTVAHVRVVTLDIVPGAHVRVVTLGTVPGAHVSVAMFDANVKEEFRRSLWIHAAQVVLLRRFADRASEDRPVHAVNGIPWLRGDGIHARAARHVQQRVRVAIALDIIEPRIQLLQRRAQRALRAVRGRELVQTAELRRHG